MPTVKRTQSLESKESLDWDRCCDSVSCQARTVRPSSQQTVPSRRPPSRESTGSSEWGWLRPNSQCRLEGMEQFKRSLRLIGLKPEDIGLESPQTDQSQFLSSTKAIDKRTTKPKLNTRLQRRTVSADDLRALLEECPVKDSVKRSVVAKAVYEEWYFKKQDEIRRRKEIEKDLETSKIVHINNQKREQLERNKTKFNEWVKEKIAKKKEELANPPDRKNLKGKRSMSNPEQAEAAFITWKESKEKQLKTERMNNLNIAGEESEKQSKRAQAEKAFQHWKEKKEEELQKIMKEKERIDKMIKEDEERIKQQKIKESEISFKVWKLKKDRELQERVHRDKNVVEKKKEEAMKAVEDRRYEANQAFLGWLDTIEQREREQQEQRGSVSSPKHSARKSSPLRSSRASSRSSSPGHWVKDNRASRPARNKGN